MLGSCSSSRVPSVTPACFSSPPASSRKANPGPETAGSRRPGLARSRNPRAAISTTWAGWAPGPRPGRGGGPRLVAPAAARPAAPAIPAAGRRGAGAGKHPAFGPAFAGAGRGAAGPGAGTAGHANLALPGSLCRRSGAGDGRPGLSPDAAALFPHPGDARRLAAGRGLHQYPAARPAGGTGDHAGRAGARDGARDRRGAVAPGLPRRRRAARDVARRAGRGLRAGGLYQGARPGRGAAPAAQPPRRPAVRAGWSGASRRRRRWRWTCRWPRWPKACC